MTTKKSNKADLERKRPVFFQIGLLVAISLSILAFEWPTEIKNNNQFTGSSIDEIEVDLIPPTFAEIPKPPAPPIPITAIEFEIVDDEIDVDEPDEYIFEIDEEAYKNFINLWDDDESEEVENTPFVKVEHMPTFNGGDINAFHKYVQEHVTYPASAQDIGISGKVVVNFVVDENGNIINIRILRTPDTLLDEAVTKVLKNSPKWKPGKQLGKAVKVQFTIPVFFKLQ